MAKKKKVEEVEVEKEANSKVKKRSKEIEVLLIGLRESIDELLYDSRKFDKGTIKPGVRVRVGLQGIIKEAKLIRGDILEKKKKNKKAKMAEKGEKGEKVTKKKKVTKKVAKKKGK